MEETPQEKKLRLAKVYLEELRQLGESRPVTGGAAPGAEPGAHAPCLRQRRSGRRRRRRRRALCWGISSVTG